jgi:hypothetical protein
MANRLAPKLNDLVSVSQMPSLRRDAYTIISFTSRKSYDPYIARTRRHFSSSLIFQRLLIWFTGLTY